MAASVGQLQLDLLLNSAQFKNQLQSSVSSAVQQTSAKTSGAVSSAFGKLGKMAVAAFSVSAIVNFSKSAMELGSDLAEVQNVVDTTFGSMSEDINNFAATAITNFGLSETVAKRYTGTIGAMAKAFGYTDAEAASMSKTLTGLVGDVSSFYNLDSETAFNKLKGVFTGETEGLKSLGIVMTQAALDEYALANGFGKTTKAMTEQEKVALRYSYVQAKLAGATGDFIRTQDGWANQTRVLSLQWDSFKAQIGQGLINALTPIIKVINKIMTKLVELATMFNKFTESIFGKKESDAIAETSSDIATDMETAESGMEGTASAAKKLQKTLLSIDNLNLLADNSSDEDTGTSSALNIPKTASDTSSAEKSIGNITDKLKNLKNLFPELIDGFNSVFDKNQIKDIVKNIKSIGSSLRDIFTNPKVLNAMASFKSKALYALGQILGSAAQIGTTLVKLLTGSIAKFLEENKGFLVDRVASLFGTAGELYKKMGNVAAALAKVFDVFGSESAQQIGSNILTMIVDPIMTLMDILLRLKTDVFDIITGPIVDNVDKIKNALQNLLDTAAPVFETIKNTVVNACNAMIEIYEKHLHPLFVSIRDGISSIVSTFLDAWTTYIQPVLDELAAKFTEVWQQHVDPVMKKLGTVIGKLIDLIKILWENYLQPLVEWVVKNVVPVLAPIIKTVGSLLIDAFGNLFHMIELALDGLEGLIDFLTGVFTGDWSKAWNGLGKILQSVWDSFVSIVKTPLNLIIDVINWFIRKINEHLSIDVPKWVPGVGGQHWGANIPQIPHLATGGYVKPNTPQLAMIGDNRHEGEIVAPESKIADAVSAQMLPLESAIMRLISVLTSDQQGTQDITIPIYLDGGLLDSYIITAQDRKSLRTGGR